MPMRDSYIDEVGLPVHRALQQRDRRSFDVLLYYTARFPFYPSRAYYDVNSQGINCLHLCAYTMHPDAYFARRILESLNKDEAWKLVNSISNQGEYPLHCALRHHCFHLADLFLRFGADPEALDKGSRTTILGRIVAENSSSAFPVLKYLLDETPGPGDQTHQRSPPRANFDISAGKGITALHVACIAHLKYEAEYQAREVNYNRISPTLGYLTRKAVRLNKLDSQDASTGNTALHLAVISRNEVAVRQLLRAGAKPNIRSNVDARGRWAGLGMGLTPLEALEQGGSYHAEEQDHRARIPIRELLQEFSATASPRLDPTDPDGKHNENRSGDGKATSTESGQSLLSSVLLVAGICVALKFTTNRL
jgi:ankyrin repeat protein